tara:strand:- start:125 stop:505 length:381 start_codon:yes stop_codon:yes gene_type:complete
MSDNGENTLKSELLEGKPLIKPSSTNHILYEKVVLALKTVFDPEIPVNIYDLGLIYTIELDEKNNVNIYMTLTAAGCPVADEMPGWVADAIKTIEEIKKIHVEMVWEPMWGMDMMSDEARLELGFM